MADEITTTANGTVVPDEIVAEVQSSLEKMNENAKTFQVSRRKSTSRRRSATPSVPLRSRNSRTG